MEPDGTPEWLDVDYALIEALQIIEDHTDPNGLLIWVAEADNVDIQAVRKISKFDSARERRTTGTKYKAQPGEYFHPQVDLIRGEYPTYRGWLDEKIQEASKN